LLCINKAALSGLFHACAAKTPPNAAWLRTLTVSRALRVIRRWAAMPRIAHKARACCTPRAVTRTCQPAGLNWTVDFNFQPDRKPTTNGINAGESLAFNLGGVSLADIQSGSFKFGLHIQALPGGRSEKLINLAPPAVPEPEAYATVLAGLADVGGMAARRRVRG